MTATIDLREMRLIRYALGYLEVSLNGDLEVEAAQEVAPETQRSGEPLPDVRELIKSLRQKLVTAGTKSG